MAKNSTSGLTLRHKIGYGLGDAGGSMTFVMVGMYATRFYVNVLKIDTALMATILLIWNIWDAVNDPLMGALMDKSFAKNRNPKGKFRPWLLRATPLLAISGIAFFTVPTFLEGTAMLIALFFLKILYEGSYTMFNIPMGSLLSAMSKNDEERAQLSSARGFGGMVGGILPMVFIPIMLGIFGENSATAYAVSITICAVIGFVMCFFHYKWTEERAEVLETSEKAENVKITDILEVFKKNRAFLALCVHSICICTQSAIIAAVGTYMYSDVLGNIALMSMSTALSLPISIVVLAIAPKITQKISLTKFIRIGLLCSVALFAGLFAVMMVTEISAVVYLLWSAIASSFANISTQMQWGLVGEAIDYNEYLTGKRTEGSIYGTFSLSRRMGNTLASSLALLMLGWIGYNPDVAVQTASTIIGIKVLNVLVPAICILGSWIAFKFIWNITPEVTEKMNAFFEAKKASAEK